MTFTVNLTKLKITNNMRLPILLPIAVLITTFGLTSCSSTEDLNIKYPYMLTNTECLGDITGSYTEKSPLYEGKITINNHAITIPYRI